MVWGVVAWMIALSVCVRERADFVFVFLLGHPPYHKEWSAKRVEERKQHGKKVVKNKMGVWVQV